MTFKQALMAILTLCVFTQNPLWAQNTKTTTVTKPAPVFFDAPRKPFSETDAGKAYFNKYGKLPDITDTYGHPMPQNPLRKQAPLFKVKRFMKPIPQPYLKAGPKVLPKKFNPNERRSFLKVILDFIIPSAVAYDADPNIPGLINCRSSNLPPNAGYFKAYFEDLAFNNGNGTGAGYDHPNFGTGRVNVACEILEEIANITMMDEPGGATPEIIFTKDWPADAPANALASAAPYSITSGSGLLHKHIISRNDPATGPDGVINTNWTGTISWSVDTTLNSGTFDFKTVIRHELLHAMGFMSRLPPVIPATGVALENNHYDRNLYSPASLFYSSGLSPLLQVPVGYPPQWFINNASIYNGKKNYVNATLDGARPIYTPPSYQPGSSVSHFDMFRTNPVQSYVMHPSIGPGEVRLMHNHEKEVLCHLGYQVRGLCEQPTPIANDDVGQITLTSTDIAFINNPLDSNGNDFSFSGGDSFSNLTLNSVEVKIPTTAPNIFYYDNVSIDSTTGVASCSGAVVSLSSAKCMRVPTPTSAPILKIIYTLKDNVSGRISDPASILYTRCVISTQDEHVCNGTFEMGAIGYNGVPTGFSSITFSSNLIPFWKNSGLGSPDLAQKNPAGQPSGGPFQLPFSTNGVYVNNFADNSTYGAFLYPWDQTMEAVSTKLRAPLIVGQCYRMYFQGAKVTKWGAINNDPVKAKLSVNDILGQQSLVGLYEPLSEVIPNSVSGSPSYNNVAWYNFEEYFIPSQPFEYLAIQTPYYPSGNTYVYMDNVSLKKVAPSFCSNNSISGVVYNDINSSGNMNLGESVIPNAPVGLFDANTGAIIDQTLADPNGVYTFYSVPLAPNYYVTLISEASYQIVTEPIPSSALNALMINNAPYTFYHKRDVLFAGGGVVTGENFGVLLEGQVLLTPLTINTTQNCGQVTLSITSPSGAGYTYSWIGPNGFSSSLPNPTVSAAGTYSVVVNGPNNYSNSGTVTVSANQLVQISAVFNTSSTPISINSTVTGATPTSYSWTGPNGYNSTQQNATGVTAPGNYTVTANYGNNCSVQTTVAVQPSCAGAPPATSFNTTLNSSNNVPLFQCYLSMTANGGGECLYNYANPPGVNGTGWSTGCPAAIAGSNCCGWTNPCGGGNSGLPATVISGTVINVTSGNNGGVTLSVTGQGPFTYQWSNGQTTQNLTNVAPGTYTVIVRNANGCTSSATYVVRSPMTLTSSFIAGCAANQASINLAVTGGVGPYTYSWVKQGGGFSSNIEDPANLTSGTYTVTVTDSSVPPQTVTHTVTIPAFVPINISGSVSVTSAGGSINITATGNGPLYYNWSNGSTTEDLTNVPFGTYTVQVADANKCVQSATFTIIQAQSGSCCKVKPNANPLLDCSDPIMNFGNSTIQLGRNRCVAAGQGNSCYWDFTNPACCYPGVQGCGSVQGTTCAPPSVSIAYPFTALNVSNIAYQALYKNCLNLAQTSGMAQNYYCCVTLPGQLNLSVAQKPSCAGKTGVIDLSVSGGTAPYTYSWSNGATTQDLSNLSPGNYTVTVTSANGLTGSLSVTLLSVGPVVINGSVTNATAPNFNNGAINITVNPPVGYSYAWTYGGAVSWSSSSEDISNLSPGNYTVNATNKYGCKASKTFTLLKAPKL